jgi:hypothetical protein
MGTTIGTYGLHRFPIWVKSVSVLFAHTVSQLKLTVVRSYSGLEDVLTTGNITNYPALCAEATASFSVLSETINAVQNVLREKHQRKDLVDLIVQLQSKEQKKLNLTAALHLEKIRERDHQDRSDGGGRDQIAALLRQGVVSLQNQITSNVEEINEVLQELQCSLIDEEDQMES